MSEKTTGGNFSIDTYISKQENLLVEYIRRFLQAETKVHLLETALQEMHRKTEDLSKQAEDLRIQIELRDNTIEQSVAGLQAVTVERDNLKARNQKLDAALTECNEKRGGLQSVTGDLENKIALLQEEIKQRECAAVVSSSNYSTLKSNYDKVLAALNEADSKIARLEAPIQKSKPKKQKNTTSEWVDGE